MWSTSEHRGPTPTVCTLELDQLHIGVTTVGGITSTSMHCMPTSTTLALRAEAQGCGSGALARRSVFGVAVEVPWCFQPTNQC